MRHNISLTNNYHAIGMIYVKKHDFYFYVKNLIFVLYKSNKSFFDFLGRSIYRLVRIQIKLSPNLNSFKVYDRTTVRTESNVHPHY